MFVTLKTAFIPRLLQWSTIFHSLILIGNSTAGLCFGLTVLINKGKGLFSKAIPTDNHFRWRGWCSDVDNPLCCLECYRRPHCLQTPAVDMNLSISTPTQSIRTLVSSGGGKTFARTIRRNQTQGHVSRPAVRLDTKMGCQTLRPLQTLMSVVAQGWRCDVWACWGRRLRPTHVNNCDFQTSVRGRGAAGRNKRQIQNFDGKHFGTVSFGKLRRKSYPSWEANSRLTNKKFPSFYWTERFITVFTKARHWSLPSARSSIIVKWLNFLWLGLGRGNLCLGRSNLCLNHIVPSCLNVCWAF
jgi:hypothetical protein